MRKDALIFYQTLPKQFLKEINGDQCVECVWGYWTGEQPGMVGRWVGGINQMQCIVFFEHLSRKTKPRPYQSPIKQTEIYIQFSV